MKFKYKNLKMDVNPIGTFNIDTHEYVVCSYMDSEKNCKIVILEIVKNGKKIKTKDIPKEDVDMVINKFNEIKSQLLGGDLYE